MVHCLEMRRVGLLLLPDITLGQEIIIFVRESPGHANDCSKNSSQVQLLVEGVPQKTKSLLVRSMTEFDKKRMLAFLMTYLTKTQNLKIKFP